MDGHLWTSCPMRPCTREDFVEQQSRMIAKTNAPTMAEELRGPPARRLFVPSSVQRNEAADPAPARRCPTVVAPRQGVPDGFHYRADSRRRAAEVRAESGRNVAKRGQVL